MPKRTDNEDFKKLLEALKANTEELKATSTSVADLIKLSKKSSIEEKQQEQQDETADRGAPERRTRQGRRDGDCQR